MRVILLIGVLLSVSLDTFAQKGIIGLWDANNKAVIEIYKCSDGYFGKLVSSDKSKAKAGMPIIKDLEYADGKWTAQLYSVKREEWYNTEIQEQGDELVVEISVGLFTKTLYWKRKET